MIKKTPSPFKKSYFITISFNLLFICFLISCKNDITIHAERKNLIESVYASGKIIAAKEHNIQAMDNGTVLKKFVRDGDSVKKGQLLYTIKKETPVVRIQSKNKNTNILAPDKISFLLTNEPPAKETIYIRSDCDGVIYQSTKEPGEAVRILEPLVLIGEKSGRIARLVVDQSDISKVKTGQLVLLKSDITGSTIYEAEVIKIYPLMNEANQTFRVDATFRNQMNLPFIHNSVEGNIVIQKKENALVLPAYALSEGDSVQIRINDHQQKIKITPGIRSIAFIEILDGIDEKTPVIVN